VKPSIAVWKVFLFQKTYLKCAAWHGFLKTTEKVITMSLLDRIPFSVKCNENHFRGEVLGFELGCESVFEVRLNDGSLFHIKAEPDLELRRYSWTSRCNDQFRKFVPVIGRVVERYFKKK